MSRPCLTPGCPEIIDSGSYCRAHRPVRSFRKRYGISSSRWERLRGRALRRDGYQCVVCGATEQLEVDHIVSVVDGGTHDLDNLRTLCATHHHEKTAADRRKRAHGT